MAIYQDNEGYKRSGLGRENGEILFGHAQFWVLLDIQGTSWDSGAEDMCKLGVYIKPWTWMKSPVRGKTGGLRTMLWSPLAFRGK